VPDPRGHHLLPQTYQRGFANAKNQVRIVERETGQQYTTHMRNAFKRRDWNAVVDEQGRLDHTAELLPAEGIDTPASPGLQQLRSGDVDLSPVDRVAVGAFIAAQLGRAPHFRNTLGKFEAEVAQHTLALAAQHYSDERWEEITGERPTAELRADHQRRGVRDQGRQGGAVRLATGSARSRADARRDGVDARRVR
jgi:Protein of unknown function (DUF4238)